MTNTVLLYTRMILHIYLLMCHTGTVFCPADTSHMLLLDKYLNAYQHACALLLSLRSCAYKTALNAWIAACSHLWEQGCWFLKELMASRYVQGQLACVNLQLFNLLVLFACSTLVSMSSCIFA